MSGAMENRAAVFTSSPQDVEVYRDGSWWAGALLGWRHDATGGCQAWVRVAVRGMDETSWLPLELLRLPEPAVHLSVVGNVAQDSGDPALTGTMAAIRAVPAPRSRPRARLSGPPEPAATANLVAVPDAPEADAAATPPRRPGGRRRAPEPATGEQPIVAPDDGTLATPGRHRAPAPVATAAIAAAGRHRAAETGVWPAVRDDEPARRAELPRRRSSAPLVDEPEAHLLTRPMRLSDALDGRVPQPRRAPRGDRLTGV